MPIDPLAKAVQSLKKSGIVRVRKGATEPAIRRAEANLGVRLPPLYRQLVRRYGVIDIYDNCVYGVLTDAKPNQVGSQLGSTVDFQNWAARKYWDLPSKYLVLWDLGHGEFWCLDMTSSSSQCPVWHVYSDRYAPDGEHSGDQIKVKLAAPSLIAWLPMPLERQLKCKEMCERWFPGVHTPMGDYHSTKVRRAILARRRERLRTTPWGPRREYHDAPPVAYGLPEQAKLMRDFAPSPSAAALISPRDLRSASLAALERAVEALRKTGIIRTYEGATEQDVREIEDWMKKRFPPLYRHMLRTYGVIDIYDLSVPGLGPCITRLHDPRSVVTLYGDAQTYSGLRRGHIAVWHPSKRDFWCIDGKSASKHCPVWHMQHVPGPASSPKPIRPAINFIPWLARMTDQQLALKAYRDRHFPGVYTPMGEVQSKRPRR